MRPGAPSPADIITTMDALGTWFKAAFAVMGLGAPAETTTLNAQAIAARNGIMGDGTALYGISNGKLQAILQPNLDAIVSQSRYDSFFSGQVRQMLLQIDQLIQTNIPPGWQFTSANNRRPLDLYLTRANGNDPATPATPPSGPTVTGATGGAIPPTTVGKEPRVVVTYVGSADYYESQPSPASTPYRLYIDFNALTFTLTGTVPTGVTKLRVYRQYDNNTGVNAPYYWDQDVAVTAGAAWPAVTLVQPDDQLRADWSPPVWLQALLTAEEAALYALVLGSASQTAGPAAGLMRFSAQAFISPWNVALNPILQFNNIAATPANAGYQGIGNTFIDGQLGYTYSNSLVQFTPRTSNDNTQALQGFAGAVGAQARVTTALDATATLTNILYIYRSAANPTTNQSGTIAGPLTLLAPLGSIVNLGIPAGRIVRGITGISIAGATGGLITLEGLALRTI